MFIEQFYVESLGHYSYLIGSTEAGLAFVVDPKRDIGDYLASAQAAGLWITTILETHLHNDYVSGARELAAASGARIGHNAAAALAYDHQPLHDGDTLRFGELAVHVLETPGHTPEHLAYAVYDLDRSADVPNVILTGGDLLVGSVGRPDLLGEELGRRLAPQLYHSLHDKILRVGDMVRVLPTHGAGSSCGAAISSTRTSTIGYEKITNPYLQHADAAGFVAAVLQGQPAVPAYYARMRPTNQAGPRVWHVYPQPPALGPTEFAQRQEETAGIVLDARSALAFGGGHIPGATNVGLDQRFATWAGTAVPAGRPLFLVLEQPNQVDEVVRQLLRVGLEQIEGYLRGGMAAWLDEGRPVTTLPQVPVLDLRDRLAGPEAPQVIDVRKDDEWRQGHIAGATHIVANDILAAAASLPHDRPLALICGSGYRASVAASLLQAIGFQNVCNVAGGMSAWNACGYPVIKAP